MALDGERLVEAWAAVPEQLTLCAEVAEAERTRDPCAVEGTARRQCIAERIAGGRCTAPALTDQLLCSAHAGRLDASAGGHAKAELTRRRKRSVEETRRLAALGARGAIAERLSQRATDVVATVDVLLDASARGDLAAAKLLVPYLNQGLGLPTERVEVRNEDGEADVAAMPTADLLRLVRERRQPLDPNAQAG